MARKREEIEEFEDEELDDVEELEEDEDIEDEVEDLEEEEFEEDFDDEEITTERRPRGKGKKKKKKTKVIIAIVAALVLVAGAAVGLLYFFGFFGGGGSDFTTVIEQINLDMTGIDYDDDGFIGTEVGTRDAFVSAIEDKEDVILTADIKLKAGDLLKVYSSIYGNGHEIDATDVITGNNKDRWDQAPLTLEGQDDKITIRDVRVTCKKVEVGGTLSLDIDLSYHGYPIKIRPGVEADIIHCIFENGHRGIYIEAGAQVLIEGCIIRNCVDACISLETEDRKKGPSEVTLKNNVLMNACVAGVLIWGYSEKVKNEFYCNTLNIEGFLDIYNWKTAGDAKLMPATEGAADMGNSVIAAQIKDKKNEKFTYVDEKGEKYFHSAIIVLATGKQYGNEPTINGYEDVGYTLVDFPLGGLASSIVKEFLLVNYQGKNPAIKPGDKMDTTKIYDELKNGRS